MIMVKEAANLRLTMVNKRRRNGWTAPAGNSWEATNLICAFMTSAQCRPEGRHALQNWKLTDIPEESLKVPGKEERILHTQKIAIPDANGNPVFFLSISEDITSASRRKRCFNVAAMRPWNRRA